MRYNLRSVGSYLLQEDFQRFWAYQYHGWASRFLREWCTRSMRSKIAPMKKVAQMLRRHEDLILNWFKARGTISAGVAEGLNNKVKLTTKKGVRISDLQHDENRLVSQPWVVTGARIYPQILLRKPFLGGYQDAISKYDFRSAS